MQSMSLPRDQEFAISFALQKALNGTTVVIFGLRHGHTGDHPARQVKRAGWQQIPDAVDQAVFSCAAGAYDEKELARHCNNSPGVFQSSRPMSTGGAACVILLVEM